QKEEAGALEYLLRSGLFSELVAFLPEASYDFQTHRLFIVDYPANLDRQKHWEELAARHPASAKLFYEYLAKNVRSFTAATIGGVVANQPAFYQALRVGLPALDEQGKQMVLITIRDFSPGIPEGQHLLVDFFEAATTPLTATLALENLARCRPLLPEV